MSRNRDERGQFTEEVSLADVLAVFDTVEGPVVASGDIADATGCSADSARRKLEKLHDRGRLGRRKTAGRIVYWHLGAAAAGANPVDPRDPIFSDRPSFSSGRENLSERVDELLYGAGHRAAVTALRTIRESSTMNVLEVSESVFDRTALQFEQYGDQGISFVDHLNNVLGDEFDIDHVFAFEDDFRTLGMTRVPVDTGELG